MPSLQLKGPRQRAHAALGREEALTQFEAVPGCRAPRGDQGGREEEGKADGAGSEQNHITLFGTFCLRSKRL